MKNSIHHSPVCSFCLQFLPRFQKQHALKDPRLAAAVLAHKNIKWSKTKAEAMEPNDVHTLAQAVGRDLEV